MSLTTFAAFVAISQQPALRDISYKNGMFTINGPEGQTKVSTTPGFEAMNMTTGRLWLPLENSVITFDNKGLGFRKDNKATYATYSSIATSDKIFNKAQIDEINRDVAAKKKKLEVSALSGWEKIGESAYLLLRWDDNSGQPWLEVLMKCEMKGGKPTVSYLGRFDSLTRASGKVNDKVLFENGKLFTVTHGSTASLVETYDIQTGSFSKQTLENKFNDAKLIEGSLFGMGIERTPAKTMVISLIDRERNQSRRVAEIRGNIHNVYQPSVLHFTHSQRSTLLNLTSGAELVIPSDCGIEAINAGLLLWTPKANPKVAAIYSAGSFRTLARWTGP